VDYKVTLLLAVVKGMMMLKQPLWYKRLMTKAGLSAISLSVLLSLSACSNDTETAVVEPVVEESVVEETVLEEPVTNTTALAAEPETTVEAAEVVTPEPAESADVDTVEVAAEPEVLAADAGAQLYEAQCKVCHDNGLLNAPKYGDKAAWSGPLAKDKQTLYSHSAQGFNKMPAQAVNGVSEAQVKAAVDYMLEAVS
jgi:cytochrome c5